MQHQEGFDLVYFNPKKLNTGTVVNKKAVGRATVEVVPKPDSMSFEDAFAVSDRRPILVTIKGL